ncbi:MAG: DUF5610 domain-containing protein [Betaproteobacteria bacterium]|nr:DUF5610 domain-containing protein [Betaproteobacteria bacterium]MCL2886561.1 DUF5610 domain-containing protein [Betaproteobacteria bacterium]
MPVSFPTHHSAAQQNVNGSVDNAKMPATAAGISNSVRQSTNVQILQASASVSLQAGNQPLSLLYRAAIDRINEVLSPELGPNAIQNAVAAGVDTSPEATADRILSFSLGFFEKYAAQNPGKDRGELAAKFIDLIRGGFEKGFNEAKNILSGLGVLKGDIADGIQRTFELVQKGYDDFLASMKPAA